MNWNPEQAAMAQRQEVHPVIREATKRAEVLLAKEAIKPELFTDLYGAENVARDVESIKKKEKRYAETGGDMKKYADVLEAVVYEQIGQNDWLGPNAEAIKSSQYDDYENETDIIVEFEDPETAQFNRLSLAVDVTFGTAEMHTKFESIKKAIESGSLKKIKYFLSERSHMRGELSNVPRVVVGVEKGKIDELAGLWMNRKNKELSVHPAQIIILKEMAHQLRTFRDYARHIGKIELVKVFEREMAVIVPILREKNVAIPHSGVEEDRVYQEVEKNLQFLFALPKT